jgi:hypothetical protein
VATGTPWFQFAGASGPTDIWALAPTAENTTEIWRWNGSAWSTSTLAAQGSAIAVLAPDNAFVTSGTRIWHWNGSAWSEQVFSVLDPFIAISATGPNDIFAITARQVVHFDGATWTVIRAPSDIAVNNRPMTGVHAERDRVDFLYGTLAGAVPMRRLIRTQPWKCDPTETSCNNGVDDDCDDAVDARDSDCP